MKYLIPIIVITVFLACSQETELAIDYSKFTQITLIDTFDNELILDSASHIFKANYYPMYIGKWKDSILLEYHPENIKQVYYDVETITMVSPDSFLFELTYEYPNNESLNFFVDTSRIIGSVLRYLPFTASLTKDNPNPDRESPTRGEYLSYPVFIENF